MQDDIRAVMRSRCDVSVNVFSSTFQQSDSPIAVARPIPEEHPVTTTILFSSNVDISLSLKQAVDISKCEHCCNKSEDINDCLSGRTVRQGGCRLVDRAELRAGLSE